MTCEIQMLEEEVAAVHRYNDGLADELRACSAAVGVDLPSGERDMADVAERVRTHVAKLKAERDEAQLTCGTLRQSLADIAGMTEAFYDDDVLMRSATAHVKELKALLRRVQSFTIGEDSRSEEKRAHRFMGEIQESLGLGPPPKQ